MEGVSLVVEDKGEEVEVEEEVPEGVPEEVLVGEFLLAGSHFSRSTQMISTGERERKRRGIWTRKRG